MSVPTDLDQPCGKHFVYRDLIACGDTWHRLHTEPLPAPPVDNLPREPETFAAMRELCATVLDPLVDRFGQLTLTYAFASPPLTRHIRARIHPPLDQHAAHERTRSGKLICPRLGLAVDLLVPGVDSRRVAAWITQHTAFDRLYYYGESRPIHVSVGPEAARQIVHMRPGPSGRLIPRIVPASFLTE
jgi:hypothetical protein